MNRKAWLDAGAAVAFGTLFAWCMHVSRVAAETAVRLYGHNVDSGVYEFIAARFYFAPGAVLFAAAAAALFRRWRVARFLHGCAWGWVALPILAAVVIWLGSLMTG